MRATVERGPPLRRGLAVAAHGGLAVVRPFRKEGP
jgi:hypothetical protein